MSFTPGRRRGRTGARIASVVVSSLSLALGQLPPAPAAAQTAPAPLIRTLTLAEALTRADRGAYANRMSAGAAAVQAAEGLAAFGGILPTVRVESGYARTTDPIGAFGTTLRQRAIAAEDFDPARLNYPAATAAWTGGVVLEQPLVNVDSWLGRQAAGHATKSREASASWTREATRVDVVRAYYGAVLSAERVRTLESALEAARGHVHQAESMVEHGVATRSDALLAQVKAGEVEAQLVEARGDASLVKRQLAVLFGTPGDTAFDLPSELPSSDQVRALSAVTDVPAAVAGVLDRADVRAAEEGHGAARADVRRARSSWLPRVNGMARYDWNSPDAPFGGPENWSVGVVASWTPVSGGAQVSALRVAQGREEVARAQSEAARARAELDASAKENGWRVALERLQIADDAVVQSAEAHRIVTRKYEGGLAGVVELLSASASETEARLRHAHARWDAIVRAAEYLMSTGREPALLAGWAMDS